MGVKPDQEAVNAVPELDAGAARRAAGPRRSAS
jgi:hypothetical protein